MIRPAIDVALRKESVDRNEIGIATIDCIIDVALRKESVDRNCYHAAKYHRILPSLSARRAWIEILSAVLTELLILVALRKESVDRNAGSVLNA